MASCLAVLGDSDVPDAPQGCRREEELLFLSSGLVSLPSLIFLRIPWPLVETSCTVSRKSRHPRHIRIKTIRVQCFVTVKGSQTTTRMFHSCRKPHLALSEPNTPHQAPAFSCRTNIKAWAVCINLSMLYITTANLSALIMRKMSTVEHKLSIVDCKWLGCQIKSWLK